MDQSTIKTVTISVTINLDNYESLKVEISGEVTGPQGAADLVASLDRMLADLGRGDPRAAGRIDSYRRRVLAPPNQGSPQKTLVVDSGPSVQDTAGDQTVEATVPGPAQAAAPAQAVGDQPAATSGVAQCYQCGAEVSKSQAKLSQTLAGRVLCTICFDSYLKPKVKP